MIRKTAHQYNRQNFKGSFGQVREQIIVEASWLGSSEPYTTASVTCYVTDMMIAIGQTAMIEQYNMQPFTVKVLSKERTLCEKIMSLVRFSQTANPYLDLSNKVRHVYDIHMMLKDAVVMKFLQTDAFGELLLRVGNDDVVSFKNNNIWLSNHPADAMIFKYPEETWNRIKFTYRTTFKDLVIGVLPTEEVLIEDLKIIYLRLLKVSWEVTF